MARNNSSRQSNSEAIVPEKKLAPLIRAIDELGEAEQRYLDGEITYAEYSKFTDRVIAARDKLGLQAMRVTRR